MPDYFPEGDAPLPTDSETRSLNKAVSILNKIAVSPSFSGDVEILNSDKGVVLRSEDGTRWRLTIGNDGVIKRAVLSLIAAFFVCSTQAQTVFDLTVTNGTLQATNLRINADSGFDFSGVGGALEVEANDNHAIAARASNPTDGSAFFGWSASGAPVAKFVQTNSYTSAALSVWRTAGNYSSSPAVLVYGDPDDSSSKAVSVLNGTNEVFWVNFNGQTSDRHWLGSSSTNPTPSAEGAMYFNTGDSTVRIYADGQWRTLN